VCKPPRPLRGAPPTSSNAEARAHSRLSQLRDPGAARPSHRGNSTGGYLTSPANPRPRHEWRWQANQDQPGTSPTRGRPSASPTQTPPRRARGPCASCPEASGRAQPPHLCLTLSSLLRAGRCRLSRDPDRGAGDPRHGRHRRSRGQWRVFCSKPSIAKCAAFARRPRCGATPVGAIPRLSAPKPSAASPLPYFDKLDVDVLTFEAADNAGDELASFARAIGGGKKIAIGVNHRSLQVERPEEVAGLIRRALKMMPPERLIVSTDCGFGRQGMSRLHLFYKMIALTRGTNIVRRELGWTRPIVSPPIPRAPC
jgi:hypothetical protein